MNIRNTRELTSFAAQRLSDAPKQKRIVLIYAGLLTGLVLLTTLISHLLGLQIDQSGGLSNLGSRAILSALQAMLTPVQAAIVMCLALGYRAAMLRIARGQYASPQTLRLGFARFWVMLRCSIIQALIFLTIGIASLYLSTMIFVFTPLSRPVMEILAPIVSELSVMSPDPVLDEALYAQLVPAMAPMMLIFALVFGLLAIPVAMRYRMTDYIIIDRPGGGALAALRESRTMMRGNFLNLIKLDLRLWWYYAALMGASLLCYGDALLPMLGVQLPLSRDAAYYLFYAVYLALQFAIYYYLSNRVEASYALAYDAIRPQEKKEGGVVLGNIFNM